MCVVCPWKERSTAGWKRSNQQGDNRIIIRSRSGVSKGETGRLGMGRKMGSIFCDLSELLYVKHV